MMNNRKSLTFLSLLLLAAFAPNPAFADSCPIPWYAWVTENGSALVGASVVVQVKNPEGTVVEQTSAITAGFDLGGNENAEGSLNYSSHYGVPCSQELQAMGLNFIVSYGGSKKGVTIPLQGYKNPPTNKLGVDATVECNGNQCILM